MGDSSRSSIDLHTNSAKRHVRSHGADERRRQDERHAREVRHGHVRCLEGGRGPSSLGRPCEERGYSRGSHGRVLALPLQRLQRDVHHLQSLARWGRGNLRLEHHSSASWEARVPSPRAQAGGHRQGLCLHLRQRQDLHQQGYWGLLQDRHEPALSLKAGAVLYAMAKVSSMFTLLTLAYIATVGAFAGPKIYTLYREDIDMYVDIAKSKVDEVVVQAKEVLNEKILSKIKPPAKKTE